MLGKDPIRLLLQTVVMPADGGEIAAAGATAPCVGDRVFLIAVRGRLAAGGEPASLVPGLDQRAQRRWHPVTANLTIVRAHSGQRRLSHPEITCEPDASTQSRSENSAEPGRATPSG